MEGSPALLQVRRSHRGECQVIERVPVLLGGLRNISVGNKVLMHVLRMTNEVWDANFTL